MVEVTEIKETENCPDSDLGVWVPACNKAKLNCAPQLKTVQTWLNIKLLTMKRVIKAVFELKNNLHMKKKKIYISRQHA